MKIIYCIPQLYRPGGIERIVTIKANYLAEVFGYDVAIVVADQKGKIPFYKLSDKVKVVDLGLDYDGTLNMPIWKRIMVRCRLHKLHKEKLERFLLEQHPDITISTFTHEASFLPDIKDGSKKVLEFHFCRRHKRKMADAFNFSFIKRMSYYFKCWQEENIIIPKYDQFVVLTEEDRRYWKSKIPTVRHISNILPFAYEERAELNEKNVIAVGRLDAQKRFDRLIDIWARITKMYPDWHLNIYGQGTDRNKLQKQIENCDCKECITLHEPDPNIKHRYLESSIFCMTSAYEGLPMTLLEATGLGLPAICYDFTCGPKDVIKNGINGYLVKEGDEATFVQRLSELMDSAELRKSMGGKTYELSLKYGKERIMRQWMTLFKELSSEDKSKN